MYAPRRRRPLLTPIVSLAAVAALAYCGSSLIPTAGASAAKKPAASLALSGTWSGKYGGAYSGTFTLHWTQSGSKLSGTIKLSRPSTTLSVHGTVHEGSIRFGTVGSVGITYTGSVSKGAMAGNYNTLGGGGPWSAHKTS